MLSEFTLAYETYGRLNADKSNVVLLFHALSGSQHAAGVCEQVPGTEDRWTEDCRAGWWGDFIGPGKALDTNKWFVVCVNFLGGCYGTSGPSSVNPATGKAFGASFPHVTINDVVRSQKLLLEHLGVEMVHAVIGVSTGGLMAINFATLYPDRVNVVIPIATGGRTTVLNRLIIFEQILAIENDPNFGNVHAYYGLHFKLQRRFKKAEAAFRKARELGETQISIPAMDEIDRFRKSEVGQRLLSTSPEEQPDAEPVAPPTAP